MLLPDTQVPITLKRQRWLLDSLETLRREIREACRALKGAVLRREIYARDGTECRRPPLQRNRAKLHRRTAAAARRAIAHAVFFTHPRESIGLPFERKLYR